MGVYGAIAGAIVGGVLSYSANKNAASNRTRAIKDAAERLRKANEEYSGDKANALMTARGNAEANMMRNLSGAGTRSYSGGTQFAQAQNAANDIKNQMQSATSSGYNLGAGNAETLNAANLAKEEKAIQNQLKQADVEFNADTARTQGYMNAASGLVDVANKIGNPFKKEQTADSVTSDENAKEADDGIDDVKLLEAIEQFKKLKERIDGMSNNGKEKDK